MGVQGVWTSWQVKGSALREIEGRALEREAFSRPSEKRPDTQRGEAPADAARRERSERTVQQHKRRLAPNCADVQDSTPIRKAQCDPQQDAPGHATGSGACRRGKTCNG